MKSGIRIAVAGLMAVSAAACGREYEPIETGEVALTWYVGPHGCAEAQAERVVVSRVDGRTGATLGQWDFACEARYGAIDGLAPGSYLFELEALTVDGRATFIGSAHSVEVRPGGTTSPPPVVMEATPARLTVEWNFGGPLCRQAGASWVSVMAFDPWGTIEEEKGASCEAGVTSLTIRPGVYDVVIQALSPDGLPTHEILIDVALERGDDLVERVELEAIGN
jgi:hypothetical protein